MAYTIHYFDIRGLAEGIRLLLEDAGVPYKDVRIKTDEEWKAKQQEYFDKAIAPFYQLPSVEWEGQYYAQTSSAARMIAKTLGYYGGNDIKVQHAADSIDDGVAKDWRQAYYTVVYPEDPSKQAELQKKYIEESLPRYLLMFERALERKENGQYYFAGKEVTYADFILWELLDANIIMAPGCLEKFPLLSAFHIRVAQRPNIKSYLSSGRRPVPINYGPYGYPQ